MASKLILPPVTESTIRQDIVFHFGIEKPSKALVRIMYWAYMNLPIKEYGMFWQFMFHVKSLRWGDNRLRILWLGDPKKYMKTKEWKEDQKHTKAIQAIKRRELIRHAKSFLRDVLGYNLRTMKRLKDPYKFKIINID